MKNNRFGSTIKWARKKLDISQRNLAREIGVDYTYISKIENGIMPPPSEETILAFSNNLKLDFADLMFAAGKIPTVYVDLILKDTEVQKYLRHKHKEQIWGVSE